MAAESRVQYSRPELRRYGAITRLLQGPSGGMGDGVASMSENPVDGMGNG
jgi:hypothetical protein